MSENTSRENIDNKEFAFQLEERTRKFAVSIIKLKSLFPKTVESKVICYQILKSGTSIGANYREANRSVSSADFRNKISICAKEASETEYWLEVIMEVKMLKKEQVLDIYKECGELLAIFT
jgi:four helix bundle protein